MTIKEFRLLEIDVYDKDKLIYSGMCEDCPDDIKSKHIRIKENVNKKIIVELI